MGGEELTLEKISGPETLPLYRIEKKEEPDFRDTTLLVIRHAEPERSVDTHSSLSEKGILQAQETAESLISQLKSVEGEIAIKFYTSPKPRCVQTAEAMIEVLERAREEDKLPESVKLFRPTSRGKPAPRERFDLDMLKITEEDVKVILDEYIPRKKKGEKISFEDVWVAMDNAGLLTKETESQEDVRKRFIEWAEHLQKLIGRIPPQGPKLILIGITHNIISVPMVGEEIGLCESFRIDFPLYKKEKPKLIFKNQAQELES